MQAPWFPCAKGHSVASIHTTSYHVGIGGITLLHGDIHIVHAT